MFLMTMKPDEYLLEIEKKNNKQGSPRVARGWHFLFCMIPSRPMWDYFRNFTSSPYLRAQYEEGAALGPLARSTFALRPPPPPPPAQLPLAFVRALPTPKVHSRVRRASSASQLFNLSRSRSSAYFFLFCTFFIHFFFFCKLHFILFHRRRLLSPRRLFAAD